MLNLFCLDLPCVSFLHLKVLLALQDDRSRANKEKEELDRAVALSLNEDLSKPNGNTILLFPQQHLHNNLTGSLTKVIDYGKLILQDIDGDQPTTKI